MQAAPSGVDAPIRIATSGVFEFECLPVPAEVGDLIVVDEEGTGGLKPYVLVRGRLEALVARPVMYELVGHGEEIEVGGRRMFSVRSGGEVFPIVPAERLQGLSA